MRAQLVRLPLTPVVTLWQDIDKVRGTFVETSLLQPLPLVPLYANLDVIVTAGISVSQALRSKGNGSASRNGVTYVDIALAPNFRVGAVAIRAAWHYQLNRDSLTRRGGTLPRTPERGHTSWASLGMSTSF